MNHSDHKRLIHKAVPSPAGIWGDFGSGTGAFTLALADIAGQDIEIYSIDIDQNAMAMQASQFARQFPETRIQYLTEDFTGALSVPMLDGIILANTLHFHTNKNAVLHNIKRYLKSDGRIIFIEYNVDAGNNWVPYPFSFKSLHSLAKETGFSQPELLSTIPSEFLNEIYSAVVYNT